MTRVEANVFGDRALLQRLRLIRTQAGAPRAALHKIADDFLRMERRRFAGANTWSPLKPGTVATKAAAGRPAIPLAGGDLERSLTVRGSKGSIRRVNQNGMIVGTRNPVARIHQGSKEQSRGRGGVLPRRAVVVVRPDDRSRWAHLFGEHLVSRDRAFRPGL